MLDFYSIDIVFLSDFDRVSLSIKSISALSGILPASSGFFTRCLKKSKVIPICLSTISFLVIFLSLFVLRRFVFKHLELVGGNTRAQIKYLDSHHFALIIKIQNHTGLDFLRLQDWSFIKIPNSGDTILNSFSLAPASCVSGGVLRFFQALPRSARSPKASRL